jgi:hypothetical protein
LTERKASGICAGSKNNSSDAYGRRHVDQAAPHYGLIRDVPNRANPDAFGGSLSFALILELA